MPSMLCSLTRLWSSGGGGKHQTLLHVTQQRFTELTRDDITESVLLLVVRQHGVIVRIERIFDNALMKGNIKSVKIYLQAKFQFGVFL